MESPNRASPLKRQASSLNSAKSISSIKVFLSHVSLGEGNEDADVSEVFSLKCFNNWLNTRTSKIKHPEQSFQRALYAHIRGADGRKPFPEKVEQALLKKLRGEMSSSTENPWTKMFGENSLRLGKKGFKKKGYHEKKKLTTTSDGDDGVPSPNMDMAHIEESRMKQFVAQQHGFNMVNSHAPPPHLFPPQQNPFGYDAYNMMQMMQQPAKQQRLETGQRKPTDGGIPELATMSPYEVLINICNKYYPPGSKEREEGSKCHLYDPNVVSSLSNADLTNDIDFRYRWDFIKPPPQHQRFDPLKPIAKLVWKQDWVCCEDDEVAKEMFGYSFVGSHVLDLVACLESVMFSNIRTIPELVLTGRTWTRIVFKGENRPNGVFILETTVAGDNFISYVQEQSELFPLVLQSPHFS